MAYTKPNTPAEPAVRRRMQRQRRRDTAAEMVVRRAVWARGLRYRVDVPPVQGSRRRADMVFSRVKVAVWIDGCFWHRCPLHGTFPKSNRDWWIEKLARNVERDRDTDLLLQAQGWVSHRVWEHEDPEMAADVIARLVAERLQDPAR